MSILDRLFRRERTRTKTELINEPVSGFSMYGGDAYSNDIFREAVDAIARNAGKLKGSHVVTYAGERHETTDGRLNRLLQTRPNRYMSSYDFLYKLTTRLFLYNNAFAYID